MDIETAIIGTFIVVGVISLFPLAANKLQNKLSKR